MMCGIAGILNNEPKSPIDREALAAMATPLAHRGPDGNGFWSESPMGLAHTRLSIIDLESGDQPIHNEDESVWVILNGEIFNYIELTQELKKRGHRFYTKSDTEVIVHLYEEFGDNFPTHLNGQFAIALWDKRLQKLLLVRDRPGIAPLFFTRQRHRLLFASEIKAILPVLDSPPRMNLQALDQLMTFWVPVSPSSIFEGIFEVGPGELIRIENGKFCREKYWDWQFPPHGEYNQQSEDRLANELHDLLVDAVRLRLRSDVPVGAYLSGGLDSSVLTALIHHYGDAPLRTFSIGFSNRGLDETEYQQTLIKHLNADHSRVFCEDQHIGAAFLDAIWHTEIPILRTAPVPMKKLSGLVHEQGYRVVLTGEGADEVLGGYDLFKETKIRQFWARNPDSVCRPLLLKKLYPYLEISPGRAQSYLQKFFGQGLAEPDQFCFSHIPRFLTTAKCKDFFSDELKGALRQTAEETLASFLPEEMTHWHYFNRAQYLEAKSLMAGYLLSSQGDRMLLANSVEGRFPFLDHRVIEFANRLHPRLKMKVLNEKYLLKQAAGKYLPRGIVKRHKQPYRAPDIPSFFGRKVPEYVESLLSGEKICDYGYFNAKKVELLLKKIRHGRAIGYKDNMALVGILSTQIWHYHFVENYVNYFS